MKMSNGLPGGQKMQFKISSTEGPQIKGMTVFNTEQVDTKKQPMFLELLLEFRDTILISIQFLIN